MGTPLLKHPLEKEATDAKEDNDDTLEIEPGIIIINSIFRQEETSKEEDLETLPECPMWDCYSCLSLSHDKKIKQLEETKISNEAGSPQQD